MITATEVRNRMPAARVLPDGLIDMETAVEEILPMIEKEIIEMAEYGGDSILIKKSEITHYELSGYCVATHKEVMDGIAKALREAKFSVSIPNSYSSIHIDW